MSQRRSGPCGLFSRAEEKKLSNDEIEEAFTDPRQFVELLFIRHYLAFYVGLCLIYGLIVRPWESTAETQPQLQPALLRLSAMISQ